MLCCLLVQIWCLMRRRGVNWLSLPLVARLLLPTWVPQPLRTLLLLLPLLQSLLNQPPSIRGKKGAVEAIASEDEDTCIGLVFKRKKGADVVAPSHSASDDHAPSFRDHPPSASSPRELMVLESGGRAPLEVVMACPLLLICPLSSRRFSKPSKSRK